MKSDWKPIKLGVPGNMRSICLPLGVPLNILPGYGGPSLKSHLCRLKVRLKRGKGDQRREMKKSRKQALVMSETSGKVKGCHSCGGGTVDEENPGMNAVNPRVL